ncbi:MAG: hypothetical protein H0W25_04215 [Acidimicrobiia bacterium]|nr:hypothetical protein [Acidimicrobiia bacterium]
MIVEAPFGGYISMPALDASRARPSAAHGVASGAPIASAAPRAASSNRSASARAATTTAVGSTAPGIGRGEPVREVERGEVEKADEPERRERDAPPYGVDPQRVLAGLTESFDRLEG